jgi:hypothetical protein
MISCLCTMISSLFFKSYDIYYRITIFVSSMLFLKGLKARVERVGFENGYVAVKSLDSNVGQFDRASG